jgi:hypothetical protein
MDKTGGSEKGKSLPAIHCARTVRACRLCPRRESKRSRPEIKMKKIRNKKKKLATTVRTNTQAARRPESGK